jgi:hypothetical protein
MDQPVSGSATISSLVEFLTFLAGYLDIPFTFTVFLHTSPSLAMIFLILGAFRHSFNVC